MPIPGGYWLSPARIAAIAASITSGGPSVSGKPWPRLIDPVATASADISAKIVVPKPRIRSTRNGFSDVTSHQQTRAELVEHVGADADLRRVALPAAVALAQSFDGRLHRRRVRVAQVLADQVRVRGHALVVFFARGHGAKG